jgi:hypothetical protein
MKTKTAVAEETPRVLSREFQLNLIRELAKAQARKDFAQEG